MKTLEKSSSSNQYIGVPISIGRTTSETVLQNFPCGRLQPATREPPQPSHTETPIHIETRTHNQCGDAIEKSQAPDDGCINVRNKLSIEEVK